MVKWRISITNYFVARGNYLMKGSSVATFTGAALAPKEQPVITYQKPTGDIDSSGGAS